MMSTVLVAETATRATARRSETLKCPGTRTLKIAGVVPLNDEGQPASASASVCPYLAGLLPAVQGKCDGRRRCQLSRTDISVSNKQCPGVASVNFRVRCIKKGIFTLLLHCPPAQKNDADVGRYSIDIYHPILTVLAEMLPRE